MNAETWNLIFRYILFGCVLRQLYVALKKWAIPTLQDQFDQAQHLVTSLELRKKHLTAAVTQQEHELAVCARELADIKELIERWHKRLQEEALGKSLSIAQRLDAYVTNKRQQLIRYNREVLQKEALKTARDCARDIVFSQYSDDVRMYEARILEEICSKGIQ